MKSLLVAILLLQATAQNGRTVTGSVTPAPGAVAADIKAVRVAMVSSGTPPQTMEAAVNADGSFRFSEVPVGPYIVRLLPIGNNFRSETPYPAQAILVADRDITGLQLAGPAIVTGRVVVEGGGRLPLSPLNARPDLASLGTIEIRPATTPIPANGRGGSPMTSSGVRPDHTFVVGVPSGDYLLSARFPANYSVRSMTYGSVNLLQDPLRVSGPSATEIVITLVQAPGVSIRGRVTGRPAGAVPSDVAIVTAGANATINADGTFELRGIPPGNRVINLSRLGASPFSGQTTQSRLATANLTVTDIDIENVELAWMPLTPLTGQLTLVDKTGAVIPGVPPGATVTVTSRDGKALSGGCDYSGCRADILSLFVQPDGSLNASYPRLVPPTVADVAVTRLSPGYVVKSITAGGVDLLKDPLRIEAATSSVNLQVVVQNNSGARVAGRVVTSREAPLLPQRVSLVSAPGIVPGALPAAVQSAVAGDGTFQFAGIAPGVYTLTSDSSGLVFSGSTTSNIIVGDQDLPNVPLTGLSDAHVPSTLQYANEAATVLNISAIQQAQIYYNGLRQRYGTLEELIAAGFLSPAYARTISGYTLSITSSGTDITGAAIPVTTADGRYEFYFTRSGGVRALKLTGPPASARTVSLDTLDRITSCGSDMPLCLRLGPTAQQFMLNLQGRLTVVAGPGGSNALPSGLFAGAVSSLGVGNLAGVRSDGAFQIYVAPGASEYRFSIPNLPAGYTVRSIQSGGRELPNGVFTNAQPFLEVTLESVGR